MGFRDDPLGYGFGYESPLMFKEAEPQPNYGEGSQYYVWNDCLWLNNRAIGPIIEIRPWEPEPGQTGGVTVFIEGKGVRGRVEFDDEATFDPAAGWVEQD